MKRLVSIIGIGLMLVVLSFLGWFFLEYRNIRQGIYQLADLPKEDLGEFRLNLGGDDSLELGFVRGIYLGKKKNLEFLSLDNQGNPVLFKMYSGEFDEDYKIKMMVEADEEGSYGIVEFNGNELISKIKENDLMELYVVKEATTEEFLNRMQAGDENELELIGLIKGFFGYRNLVLPVFMVNIL